MPRQTYFNVVYTSFHEEVYRVTYFSNDHKIVNIEKRRETCPLYDPFPKDRWKELTKQLLWTAGNSKVVITGDGYYIPRNTYTNMTDEEVLMMDTLEDFNMFKAFQQV